MALRGGCSALCPLPSALPLEMPYTNGMRLTLDLRAQRLDPPRLAAAGIGDGVEEPAHVGGAAARRDVAGEQRDRGARGVGVDGLAVGTRLGGLLHDVPPLQPALR